MLGNGVYYCHLPHSDGFDFAFSLISTTTAAIGHIFSLRDRDYFASIIFICNFSNLFLFSI